MFPLLWSGGPQGAVAVAETTTVRAVTAGRVVATTAGHIEAETAGRLRAETPERRAGS